MGTIRVRRVWAVLMAVVLLLPGVDVSAKKVQEPDVLPSGVVARLGDYRLRAENLLSSLAFGVDGSLISVDGGGQVRIADPKSWKVSSSFEVSEGFLGRNHALSVDGSVLVTFGKKAGKSRIMLWDTATGKRTHTFDAHPAGVNALALSPDGTLVASADTDDRARLWDVSTGKVVHELRGREAFGGVQAIYKEAPVFWEEYDVSFSPDGKLVSTAHKEGEIRVHEVATGIPLHSFEGTSHGPAPVFLPDGKTMVWTGYQAVHLFDLDAGQTVVDLKVPGGPTMDRYISLTASPDGKSIAAGTNEASVFIWDLDGGGGPARILAHSDRVEVVAFSADSRLLASGGRDRTVGVWDVDTATDATGMVRHFGWITDMEVSPDGTLLATAGEDAWVHVWDLTNGKLVQRLYSEQSFRRVWMDHSLEFTADGSMLWSASTEGDLVAWDPRSGKEFARHDSPSIAADMSLSPDGKTMALVDAWHAVVLFDIEQGKMTSKISEQVSWGYHFVRWTHAGARLATAGMDSKLRLWDVKTGKLIEEKDFDQSVYQLVVSADGSVMGVRTYDQLHRWRLGKGGEWVFEGKTKVAGDVALSSDGTLMAVSNSKAGIAMFEEPSGKKLHSLGPAPTNAHRVVFGPTGDLLCSVHLDGTVLVWKP